MRAGISIPVKKEDILEGLGEEGLEEGGFVGEVGEKVGGEEDGPGSRG